MANDSSRPIKNQSSDKSEHSKGCALLAAVLLTVAVPVSAEDAGFFTEYIEPLMKQHCYECHSHEAGEASGGLVLDSKAGWMVGGDSGPAIVPRQLEKSLLWRAVAYKDDNLQMPPDGKLPDNDLTLLKKWIESGAIDPRTGGQAAQRKTIDIEAGKQWWAFRPFWSAATRRRFGSPATQPPKSDVESSKTPGERPTHPQLLDDLAAKFVAGGWRLKPLVRELVLSQTYRQAVGTPPQSDPENRLLSCQHRRRLDPEEIRDTLLVLSGRLDATPGEGMLDALPISDVSNLGDYLKIQDNRRTIYQPLIRTLEPDVLQLFDSANNAMVTGARPKTVVAPQALYFLNSSFVQSSAERIAATRFKDTARDASLPDVVDEAFAWIAVRQPTDAERQLLVEYLRRQADGPPGLTQHDITKLCQTILGSTQFQFVE